VTSPGSHTTQGYSSCLWACRRSLFLKNRTIFCAGWPPVSQLLLLLPRSLGRWSQADGPPSGADGAHCPVRGEPMRRATATSPTTDCGCCSTTASSTKISHRRESEPALPGWLRRAAYPRRRWRKLLSARPTRRKASGGGLSASARPELIPALSSKVVVDHRPGSGSADRSMRPGSATTGVDPDPSSLAGCSGFA
jgi:hypothetical protein